MKRFSNFFKFTWWLFIILFLAPIIIVAVFANLQFCWRIIDLEAGDWSSLFGSVIGYWGTVILGTLAFWQNHQIQVNNNVLIEYEKNKMAPFFSLTESRYQGMLEHISFVLSNCSDNIACCIEISDLVINKINRLGEKCFISRTPPEKSKLVNILEAHSQISLEYKNKKILKSKEDKILLEISITASDIAGITRKTTLEIEVGDNLEFKYKYNITDVSFEKRRMVQQ